MYLNKIKQNKNTSAMVFSSMVFLIIAVFLLSVPFSVFADVPFSPVPTSSGILRVDTASDPVYVWSSNDLTYCFFYPVNDTFIAVAGLSSSSFTLRLTNGSELSSSYGDYFACAIGNRLLYYDKYDTSALPYFASLEAGYSAVIDFIEGGSSSGTYSTTLSLPPGNVAYIEITDATESVRMTSVQKFPSRLYGDAWPWSTQTYGYADSIDLSLSYPRSGLDTKIPWSRSDSGKNFLGQTYTGFNVHSVSPSNGKYFVVTNPYYTWSEDVFDNYYNGITETPNNSITLELNNIKSVKVLPVTSLFHNAGPDSGEVSTPTGEDKDLVIDPETGAQSWTSNGVPVDAPNSSNGGNLDSSPTFFDSVKNLLTSITNSISDFLNRPYQAITNLISSASAFIGQLSNLYSWLPSPVLSVLSSALVLVISIGVLKVFL